MNRTLRIAVNARRRDLRVEGGPVDQRVEGRDASFLPVVEKQVTYRQQEPCKLLSQSKQLGKDLSCLTVPGYRFIWSLRWRVTVRQQSGSRMVGVCAQLPFFFLFSLRP